MMKKPMAKRMPQQMPEKPSPKGGKMKEIILKEKIRKAVGGKK